MQRTVCVAFVVWVIVVISGGLMLDQYIVCESNKNNVSVSDDSVQKCRPIEISALILLSMALLPVVPAVMWCVVQMYQRISLHQQNNDSYSTVV